MPQTQSATLLAECNRHYAFIRNNIGQGVPIIWYPGCVTCIAGVSALCVMFGWKF